MISKIKCALVTLIICMLLFPLPVLAGNDIYHVRYGKMKDGAFVETQPKLKLDAKKGTSVRTPSVADKGGRRCYWQIHGNGGAAGEVVNGGKFTLKGNARLTPVWKKLCTIRLFKYNGAKEHKNLKITLPKGEKYKLPSIKPHESKWFYGWSKTKNASAAAYTCGKTYTMSGNMTLYEVIAPKAKYTVHFRSQTGALEFANEKMEVYDGTSITLPVHPNSESYAFLGWSQNKSMLTPQYHPGQKLKVTRDMTLYAVYVINSNVAILRYNDGNSYRSIVADGKTAVFPGAGFKGATLQGWSTKKGQTCNPEYLEGDIIPKRAAIYYMVIAPTPKVSTPVSDIHVQGSSKYAVTYFVGDSRMWHAATTFGKSMKKTKFVTRSGSQYDWLATKGNGYDKLIAKIKSDNRITKKKKAVIFCHGINDLGNKDKYIAFYNAKAKELKSLRCDIYLMSINPFSAGQREYYIRSVLPQYVETRNFNQLKEFNAALKKVKGYTYVDIYSYLMKTGWPTADVNDPTMADGLHYPVDTTAKIVGLAIRIMDSHY